MPALWNKVEGFLFGGAIAGAFSRAVEAVLEPVKQHAWQRNPVKVLDVGQLAELVAKGLAPASSLTDEATRTGYDATRLAALAALAQSFPGLADLDRMSNRDLVTDDLVEKALSRHAIPPEYHAPIKALFSDLLSVADVAAAIQQGHLPNPGILPDISAAVTPAFGAVTPTAPDGQPPSAVPLTQIDIDPVKEAAGQGFDVDRLKVRANLSGLPPGPAELLTMWNRNEITEEAVDAGLREGHLKTKWSGAFKRMRWAVLSASEYANAYIRAWVTQEEMYAGGALTGHTPDQMDLLYKNRGRPLAPVQAFTAWAREAPHPQIPGEPDRPGTFDFTDFEQAVRRSDVQTWYAPILWHNRYAYPPLFQLGRLAMAGALPEERVRTILKYERYEQEDIDALVKFWYATKSAVAKEATVSDVLALLDGGRITVEDASSAIEALGYPPDETQYKLDLIDARRVVSAKNAAVADLHTAYKKGQVTEAFATEALSSLGVASWAVPQIIGAWSQYLGAVQQSTPPPTV